MKITEHQSFLLKRKFIYVIQEKSVQYNYYTIEAVDEDDARERFEAGESNFDDTEYSHCEIEHIYINRGTE